MRIERFFPETSIFRILAGSLIVAITLIIGVRAWLEYNDQVERFHKIIEADNIKARQILTQNIAPKLAEYAVNEYDQVIYNQLEISDINGIIVRDDKMKQINKGEDFFTGYIRHGAELQRFNINDIDHRNFYLACNEVFGSTDILLFGETVGNLAICPSDNLIKSLRVDMIKRTVLETAFVAILLVIIIYAILNMFLMRPLKGIVNAFKDVDETGFPKEKLCESGFSEIRFLASQMNRNFENSREMAQQISIERQRLSNIIWGTNVGTWEWNVQTGEVIFNEKWANIIGYTLEELQPTDINTWMKYAHPEDLEKSGQRLEKCFRKESEVYECECRMFHKNGQLVWVLDRGRVVEWTEDGEPLIMAGTHTDITESIISQIELRNTQNRLSNAFKIAHAGNWIYDIENDIFHFNENFYKLYGYKYEEIGTSKMTAAEYAQKFVYPDDNLLVREQVEKSLKSETYPFSSQLEHRIICADGSIGFVAVRYYTILDETGKLTHLEGVNQNITALVEAREEAKKANHAKSDFLANMSHELRTPMMGIRGVVDLLKESDQLSDQDNELIEDLDQSSKTLMGLLNDVLDLSKIESGKFRLEYETCEPAKIVKSLTNMFSAKAGQKNLEIHTNTKEFQNYFCELDELRFRQIISNLINNAIKFTESGTITVNMSIKPQERKDTLEVEVIDTGIGMSEEDLRLIFQRFEQVDTSKRRKAGGSGLGLSISKELTKLFGGQLSVDSKIGVGTKFKLQLPVSQSTKPVKNIDDLEIQPLRILVVDDVPLNQKVISALLEKKRHHIELASNGKEAINKVSTTEFDLILMDLHMPEMDGIEATKIIRQGDDKTGKIPIIAFTADAMSIAESELIAYGFNGSVNKPVDIQKLTREIHRILDIGNA